MEKLVIQSETPEVIDKILQLLTNNEEERMLDAPFSCQRNPEEPKKEPTFQMFVVRTDEGYWGRGATLVKALDNANALSNTGNSIKRGIKVDAMLNLQWPSDRLTEKSIKEIQMQGIGTGDHKPGDYFHPAVNNYGGFMFKGTRIDIDLPMKFS